MWSRLRASVEKRGIAGTLRAAPRRLIVRRWRALQELHFDLTHGVRTRGLVWHDHRAGDDTAYAHASHYQGVGPASFRESIAALGIDAKEYVFVDIGCGSGKALVLAAQHAFRRIVGVELSPELAHAAKLNIERLRRRGTTLPPVEIVCADGATYAFPSLPLVVFLYNPFDETIMGRLMDQLGSCLAASRQPAFVIYETPMQRHVTDAAPFLEVHRELGNAIVYRARLAASPG
jgi:SAM-dependent methyltransferase